jgi:hypothetical protein
METEAQQKWKTNLANKGKVYFGTERYLDKALDNYYSIPLASSGKPPTDILLEQIQAVDTIEATAIGCGILYRPELKEGETDTKSYFALCKKLKEELALRVFDENNKENDALLRRFEFSVIRVTLILQSIKRQSPSELELEI